jgi:hypothetical protein
MNRAIKRMPGIAHLMRKHFCNRLQHWLVCQFLAFNTHEMTPKATN